MNLHSFVWRPFFVFNFLLNLFDEVELNISFNSLWSANLNKIIINILKGFQHLVCLVTVFVLEECIFITSSFQFFNFTTHCLRINTQIPTVGFEDFFSSNWSELASLLAQSSKVVFSVSVIINPVIVFTGL